MDPGDLYRAHVSFGEGRGALKYVLLISVAEDKLDVLVSTSKFKPNLVLLHKIDFNGRGYLAYRFEIRGTSYFYAGALRKLERSALKNFICHLQPADFEVIINGLKALTAPPRKEAEPGSKESGSSDPRSKS
jgi:hypothetical protein